MTLHICQFNKLHIRNSSVKTQFQLLSRQCNQIHEKREEMADKIQEISGETQQLKAKIKSLRDVCSKETEKAQVQTQQKLSS